MDNQTDQATLDLIIQLQLQDTQTLIKGKHREGEQSDAELAVELYRLELESFASFQYDHTMSRSIAHAVLADGELINEHVFEEEQAMHDREFAVHGEYPERISRTTTPETVMDEEMVRKLTALYVSNAVPSNGEPSSSQAAPTAASATTSEERQCVSCMTNVPFFETVQCPCSHEYCRGCIADLFKAAMHDESLFPPRCCRQTIPLGLNRIFLPAKLVEQYRTKELEYATKDRTYCHLPNCSTFIPPVSIKGDIAICPKCQSETCSICKSQSHKDNCPQDTATLDLLRIATENDWQRCYSCHRLVDLITGCNHISMFQSLFDISLLIDIYQHAIVGLSFVMFVVCSGKIVSVTSGTKIDCLTEQMLSWIETPAECRLSKQTALSVWSARDTILLKTISVYTRVGDHAAVHFNARSVITNCPYSYTNAAIVEF